MKQTDKKKTNKKPLIRCLIFIERQIPNGSYVGRSTLHYTKVKKGKNWSRLACSSRSLPRFL